jgi:hypothetical protein
MFAGTTYLTGWKPIPLLCAPFLQQALRGEGAVFRLCPPTSARPRAPGGGRPLQSHETLFYSPLAVGEGRVA